MKNTAQLGLRSTAVVAVFLAFFCSAGLAQRRLTAANSEQDFSVSILAEGGHLSTTAGGDASLGLGEVSLDSAGSLRRGVRGNPSSFVVSRQLRLQVTRAGNAQGRVVLFAYLQKKCFDCKVRLDGIELSAAPSIVASNIQINASASHRLDIEISTKTPPGEIDTEIGWEVMEK